MKLYPHTHIVVRLDENGQPITALSDTPLPITLTVVQGNVVRHQGHRVSPQQAAELLAQAQSRADTAQAVVTLDLTRLQPHREGGGPICTPPSPASWPFTSRGRRGTARSPSTSRRCSA